MPTGLLPSGGATRGLLRGHLAVLIALAVLVAAACEAGGLIAVGAVRRVTARLLALSFGLPVAGAARLLDAVVERRALQVEDLLELAGDVLHHPAEVELVQALAALLAELVQEVAQAGRAHALRAAHAALHEVAQRVLEVAEVHQVVGEGFQDVAGLEVADLLGAVPGGVADGEWHVLPPVVRPSADGVLVEPFVEVQALQHELDRRGLLGR